MIFRKATTHDLERMTQIMRDAIARLGAAGVDQWQHGYPVESYSPTCGYGLVQWTPWYEKIGPWVGAGNLQDYDKQLTRIQYEVDNNIQWENDRPGVHYDESFYDFTQSYASIDYLTRCFFWCYEYGTWSDNRITWANYWYTYITDNPPPPPVPPTPTPSDKRFKILF